MGFFNYLLYLFLIEFWANKIVLAHVKERPSVCFIERMLLTLGEHGSVLLSTVLLTSQHLFVFTVLLLFKLLFKKCFE